MSCGGLLDKIVKKDARIAVFGLGQVGMPTAVSFAAAGFQVFGIDTNQAVVRDVSKGVTDLAEPSLRRTLESVVRGGKLAAAARAEELAGSIDVFVLCIQTPVNGEGSADLSHLLAACESVGKTVAKGNLVILESTVPPGTIEQSVKPTLEESSKLKCGRDFLLAYCPERMAPGRAMEEFRANARIIGAHDEESGKAALQLFRAVTEGELLLTDCRTAELAKLVENAYRYVNIAFANDIALLCEKLRIDSLDLVRLVRSHPRVQIHTPGAGVGGPCLEKDSTILIELAKGNHHDLKTIAVSKEVNRSMPDHFVDITVKALREAGQSVEGAKMGVLGVTYKGNTSDARNSPAEPIIRKLIKLGAEVRVYDPNTEETFGATRVSSAAEALKGADCCLILADHDVFTPKTLARLIPQMRRRIIMDGKGVIDRLAARDLGAVLYGAGRHCQEPIGTSKSKGCREPIN